jgi:hypothetical protein
LDGTDGGGFVLFGERKQTDSERWARRRLSVVLQACTRARVSLVGRVFAGKNSAFGHGVGLLNIRVCKPGGIYSGTACLQDVGDKILLRLMISVFSRIGTSDSNDKEDLMH